MNKLAALPNGYPLPVDTGALSANVKVFFGEAELRNATAPVGLPYIVMTDMGFEPQLEFEDCSVEFHGIQLEIYAKALEDVDFLINWIKFANTTPATTSGLDNGTLTLDLSYPYRFMGITRQYEKRERESGKGPDSSIVHKGTLQYRVEVQVLA